MAAALMKSEFGEMDNYAIEMGENMKKRFDYEIEKAMDTAIMYLAQTFSDSGHNEKPVILHSIRVGMNLFNLGYSREIVLAGILHDILEDTNLADNELRKEFGNDIAGIVSAVTFNPSIQSKRAQNEEMFLRCREYGYEALVVKCADILDNIDYFVPTPEQEELAYILLEKYHSFLNISEEALENEGIYSSLKDKVSHAEQLMELFITNIKGTE